jgi:hypothetical protein
MSVPSAGHSTATNAETSVVRTVAARTEKKLGDATPASRNKYGSINERENNGKNYDMSKLQGEEIDKLRLLRKFAFEKAGLPRLPR